MRKKKHKIIKVMDEHLNVSRNVDSFPYVIGFDLTLYLDIKFDVTLELFGRGNTKEEARDNLFLITEEWNRTNEVVDMKFVYEEPKTKKKGQVVRLTRVKGGNVA